MTDEEKQELSSLLASLGIDAGGWAHELTRRRDHGVPLEHLIPKARAIRQGAQYTAAVVSGMPLYDVTLRFENVLAEDKDEAIELAERGAGHLVERRARRVFDPADAQGQGDPAEEDEEPSELQIPPASEVPAVDLVELILTLDELCMDPLTGETVLPDYLMISEEMLESILQDPASGVVRPGDRLTGLPFPVRVFPRTELEELTGTDAHLVAFDRREPLRETVEGWDGPDEAWEAAVRRSVER